MVTLEIALALPVMIVVSVLMLWLVNLGVVKASAQDAARSAVRELVRGADRGSAETAARRILPDATVNSLVSGQEARVTVTLQVRAPPPFAAIVQRVSAKAIGAME